MRVVPGHLAFAFVLVGLAYSPFRPAVASDHIDRSEQFIASFAGQAFEKLSSDTPQAEKRDAIHGMLRDALAVGAIARFSLGRYWPRLSDDQRREYLRLFEDFIMRGSVDRMMRYSGQLLEIQEGSADLGRRGEAQLTVVKSRFYDPEPIRIDWVVASQNGSFKVVDVVIEGLSLAQTYRDDFSSVVRREGVDALLRKLRDNQDILAGTVQAN